jgi:hypothetical protein
MAKSSSKSQAARSSTAEAMEQQMLAFAEQLGRMAGTLQVKADGWIDRDARNEQVASLRSGAAELIEQFKGGFSLSKASKKKPSARPARKAAGRSGGVVDAPGKKHRKPAPRGAAAKRANNPAAKLKAAKTMVRTSRRGGRR